MTTKLKLFLVGVTFLIGMHQDEFFVFLAQLNRGVLDKLKIDHPKNKTLAAILGARLPKLMSGEIRLSGDE